MQKDRYKFGTTSKYRGVYLCSRINRWRYAIDGVPCSISYDDEKVAARERDKELLRRGRVTDKLNFPMNTYSMREVMG